MSYSNQSWAFYASKNCQKVLFQTLKEAVDINRAILRCISYKNLLLIKEKKNMIGKSGLSYSVSICPTKLQTSM
jgi:hypothetical protein